jgi:hypothetical protein
MPGIIFPSLICPTEDSSIPELIYEKNGFCTPRIAEHQAAYVAQ